MVHSIKKTLLITALAAAIAGCTTTPTAPPLVELPQATLSDVHLERWWTTFNEPPLTALIDEALANNLDLQVAMARIDAARSQVTLARTNLYPTVNVGVDAGRARVSRVGPSPIPQGFPATGDDYRLGLNASYELEMWGKYRAA